MQPSPTMREMAMTPDQLRDHLRTLDLSVEDRSFALELFGQEPGRSVGAYALDNVVVDFYSRKCRDVRRLESHTVEQTFAYELEIDPDVISYVCQVTCRGIRRGNHVCTAHADFFVVRRSSVEIVECKPISKLSTLVERKPEEWVLDGGKYRNLVYERWAASHGIEYKIWASPSNISRYHRNLQFIYQNWDEDLSMVRREGFAAVEKQLYMGPKSIAFLMEEIPWFNAGVAAGLLADRLVHGPIGHIPITDTRNFLLSLSQEQAEAIAAECCKNINNLYAEASGPVALASSVDVAKAVARLKKLECLAREGKRATPKMRKLEERVRLARAEGRNPLDDLITNYAKCGNRSSRLTHAQSELVRGVIGSHWLKGKVATLADLYRELALQCECAGVPVPGRKALVRRVRSVSRGQRDLAVGGKRNYQANRPRSEARVRSGQALAVHSVLHIDATKVDNRVFTQEDEGQQDHCPVLYCGRDEASSKVMAHAFVFGPARREGPLILLRNYVREHAKLPHAIVIDRGTDLKSALGDLCRTYGISILTVPTGASRFNSQCETVQGLINSMVSHKLIGSTKPDKAGRSVDGKFKSRSTARLDFSTVESEIHHLLYSLMPEMPVDGFAGARERFENSQLTAPNSGIPTVVDDDFLFQTSVKLKSCSYERTRGIRHWRRSYTNADLASRAHEEKILSARRDPEDISFVWIQTTKRRYKAWCSKVSEIGHYSEQDRHFEAMWEQFITPDVESKKEELQRKNYERTSMANARQRANDMGLASGKETQAPPNASRSKVQARLVVNFDELPDLIVEGDSHGR